MSRELQLPVECCVCGDPVEEPRYRRIGNRYFCSRHFFRAQKAAGSTWSRAGLMEVGFMLAFVACVGFLFGDLGQRASAVLPASVGLGWLLSLAPAAIWMVYVYRRDRIEPEPWILVSAVFVGGMLMAQSVVSPLVDGLFRVGAWRHHSELASWVASVGVEATLQQLVTYLVVRYTVFLTDEFDEPMDGLVYATAAALGVATATNLRFVVHHGGVLPLAGASHIVTTVMVHVAASAVMGYGLGRLRFDARRGHAVLAWSFVVSVLVNGGLKRLAVLAGIDGVAFRPWITLVVASAMAGIVLIFVDFLTARLCRMAQSEGDFAFG